jgi:hypothetical protein
MPHIKFGPGILSALSTFNETLIDSEIETFNHQYILDRCPERTVAARLAVERLKLPLGLGYAILSRFGELHWSLDHLTCSIEPSIPPPSFVLMTALYLVKWLDTIDVEKEAGLVDEEEQEILARLQELLSQTDFMANEENLSAVVLELGAGLLSEACVYGCISPSSCVSDK